MSDCIYEPTGVPGEYKCKNCPHVRMLKYPPGLSHRNCPGAGSLTLVKPRTKGPGWFLAQAFGDMGYKQVGCLCRSMASAMDEWGPAGCLDRMAEILDHLAQEAAKINEPFPRSDVEFVVLLAIAAAEEAASASASNPPADPQP